MVSPYCPHLKAGETGSENGRTRPHDTQNGAFLRYFWHLEPVHTPGPPGDPLRMQGPELYPPEFLYI